MPRGTGAFMPILGIGLLVLGIVFEMSGQPLTRFGPALAAAAAAIVGVRLLSRFAGRNRQEDE